MDAADVVEPGRDEPGWTAYESLVFWQGEILTLSLLLHLWDLAESVRPSPLSHLVRWLDSGRRVTVASFDTFTFLGVKEITEDGLSIDVEAYSHMRIPAREVRRKGAAAAALAIPLVQAGSGFEFGQADRKTRVVTKAEPTVYFYLRDEVIAELGRGDSDDELIGRWRGGDSVAPARWYVRTRVNAFLQEHVRLGLAANDAAEGGGLEHRPDCLLGAAYLQFAHEIAGAHRPPRTCATCSKIFTPLHGSQVHCSDACRYLNAYRRKQERRAESRALPEVRRSEHGEDQRQEG